MPNATIGDVTARACLFVIVLIFVFVFFFVFVFIERGKVGVVASVATAATENCNRRSCVKYKTIIGNLSFVVPLLRVLIEVSNKVYFYMLHTSTYSSTCI